MNELCDLRAVRELLSRYGFHLSKALGQNFLIDASVPERIAAASGADEDCGVLEIGPGIGTLTVELARRAAKVVAVELDSKLKPILEQTLGGYPNTQVIFADVLKTDLPALLQEHFGGMPVQICANLPYYITTPILTALLEQRLGVQSITVMVQKEVAQRICAPPGSKLSGAISLFTWYYSEPELLFDVEPSSFLPQPKVYSSVMRLRCRTTPAVTVSNEQAFFGLIRAAFSQRRKTLCNALCSADPALNKQQILSVLEQMGLSADIRGERLTLVQFATLCERLQENPK